MDRKFCSYLPSFVPSSLFFSFTIFRDHKGHRTSLQSNFKISWRISRGSNITGWRNLSTKLHPRRPSNIERIWKNLKETPTMDVRHLYWIWWNWNCWALLGYVILLDFFGGQSLTQCVGFFWDGKIILIFIFACPDSHFHLAYDLFIINVCPWFWCTYFHDRLTCEFCSQWLLQFRL